MLWVQEPALVKHCCASLPPVAPLAVYVTAFQSKQHCCPGVCEAFPFSRCAPPFVTCCKNIFCASEGVDRDGEASHAAGSRALPHTKSSAAALQPFKASPVCNCSCWPLDCLHPPDCVQPCVPGSHKINRYTRAALQRWRCASPMIVSSHASQAAVYIQDLKTRAGSVKEGAERGGMRVAALAL